MKNFFIILFLVLVISAALIAWKVPVRELVTHQFSKELCSCSFVMRQSEEYCVRANKQFIAADSWEIDRDRKSVQVSIWGYTAQADYQNARTGCLLMGRVSQ